jgi:hypothetical protein
MWPFSELLKLGGRIRVAPCVRVTNSTKVEMRARVEPWGFDFPVPPGASIVFEAERPSSGFFFDVQYEGTEVSVWPEGHIAGVTVRTSDGKQHRF